MAIGCCIMTPSTDKSTKENTMPDPTDKYLDLIDPEEGSGVNPLLCTMFNDITYGHAIAEFAIEEHWEDDHEFCLGCRAVVNGTVYYFAMMWLRLSDIRMAFCAETDDRSKLVKYLFEYVS